MCSFYTVEIVPAQEVVFIGVFIEQLNLQILSCVLIYQSLKNQNKSTFNH